MPQTIICTEVSKSYLEASGDAVVVISRFSATFREGDFVALTGGSGAGKTTLLSLLSLLDTPSSGSIAFGGTETVGLSANRKANVRRSNLSILFQDAGLLEELNAYENCMLPLRYAQYPASERHGRVIEALESVGLLQRRLHRPSRLSGGERQRIGLARALVTQPRFLFCDEPTAGLDAHNAALVIELLRRFNGSGGGVVIATHDERVVSECSTHIHIQDGQVVFLQ